MKRVTFITACLILALLIAALFYLSHTRAADVQSLLDAANCGDTVSIGDTRITTSLVFRKPCGTNSITLQGPAKLTITSPNVPAIWIAASASGVQIKGLDITNDLSGMTHNDYTLAMIDMAYVAKNILIEGNKIHQNENPTLATKYLTRGKWGVSVNASFVTIKNNDIEFFGRDPEDAQATNGTAQQTHAIAISSTADHVTVTGNRGRAWYTPVLLGASDGIPTQFGTVLDLPAPTLRSIRVSNTNGLSVGMNLGVELPRSDDGTKCRNGITNPCWAVGRVASISANNDVGFAQDLFNNDRNANRVVPYAMPLVGGQAVWNGTQPSDITITNNVFDLPYDFSVYQQATNGNHPKGFIESKACLRCTVERNVFTGFPGTVAFTTVNQNGGCPWCTTAFISFRNNWLQSYTTMVLFSLTDYISLSTQGHDIVVDNNLAVNRDRTDGNCVTVSGLAANLFFTHNTCAGGYVAGQPDFGTGVVYLGNGPANGGPGAQYYSITQAPGLVVRDNLTESGNYTAIFNKTPPAPGYFNGFLNPVQDHNWFALNVAGADPLSLFPGPTNKAVARWATMQFVGGNFLVLADWALQPSSPGHNAASDGTDIGVNIAQLSAALSNVPSPTPTPTPTPAASPSPSASPTPVPTPSISPSPSPVHHSAAELIVLINSENPGYETELFLGTAVEVAWLQQQIDSRGWDATLVQIRGNVAIFRAAHPHASPSPSPSPTPSPTPASFTLPAMNCFYDASFKLVCRQP